MPRNVEIKAVVDNLDELSRRVGAVCGEAAAELLVQEDTFFHAPKGGRLKLREFHQPQNRKAELIFYDRVDVEDAKLSDYVKTEVDDATAMKEALSRAIGISGIVRKTRTVFIYKGQTRVHLDRVDGLGDFLEFEVDRSRSNTHKFRWSLLKTICRIPPIWDEDNTSNGQNV